MSSILVQTIKLLTWDLLKDIVLFPVWWYTEGLSLAWQRFLHVSFSWQHRVGLGIWVKNWFKPMYAQYDWQGRIISFFFRTITIVWKLVVFFVGFAFIGLSFALYLTLPAFAVVLFLNALFA